MTVTKLLYRRRLGYPGAGALPLADATELERRAGAWVLTFRKLPSAIRPDIVRKVSAITRLSTPAEVDEICFLGIEEDSPLAPLLIWDVVHSARVGTRFVFADTLATQRYLDLPYFASGIARIEGAGPATFRKLSPLPAEAGDLDSWTFAIPTGPEDPTLLNACVARILELEIPNKEILLCGRPAAGFKYWDHVRIVGEDITAPPVQICRKKNRLVDEASYDNICMIHDRVFLPRNFAEAVRRFGNAFPLTAMQSLFFDDHWNLVYRRYSDFGLGLRLGQHHVQGLAREDRPAPNRFAPGVFAKIERTGFVHANAHRYQNNNYPTGSLYLVKKSVWQLCPQDERLLWIEFEDIEQGERAARMGIPSRVNPHALTQSMISRPILSWLGYSTCEKVNGSEGQFRTRHEFLGVAPRKPLLKKTQARAIADCDTFLGRWGAEGVSSLEPTPAATTTTRRRLRWIVQAVSSVQIPLHRETMLKFLKDFEGLVIGDQVPYDWHEATAAEFMHGPELGIRRFFETCYEIFNHTAQRPKKRVFAGTLLEYFPRPTPMLLLGSFLSALSMTLHRQQFVIAGGFVTRLKLIWGSTPFERYATERVQPHG